MVTILLLIPLHFKLILATFTRTVLYYAAAHSVLRRCNKVEGRLNVSLIDSGIRRYLTFRTIQCCCKSRIARAFVTFELFLEGVEQFMPDVFLMDERNFDIMLA